MVLGRRLQPSRVVWVLIQLHGCSVERRRQSVPVTSNSLFGIYSNEHQADTFRVLFLLSHVFPHTRLSRVNARWHSSTSSIDINDAIFCEHGQEVCKECNFDAREENDAFFGVSHHLARSHVSHLQRLTHFGTVGSSTRSTARL